MSTFIGEVHQGEKGFLASVSNGVEGYIIHPMGERANREFYSRGAAAMLAKSHAGHANDGCDKTSSSWHRVA